MEKPLESDWKTSRKRVPEWRERYLIEQNKQIIGILTDARKTRARGAEGTQVTC